MKKLLILALLALPLISKAQLVLQHLQQTVPITFTSLLVMDLLRSNNK